MSKKKTPTKKPNLRAERKKRLAADPYLHAKQAEEIASLKRQIDELHIREDFRTRDEYQYTLEETNQKMERIRGLLRDRGVDDTAMYLINGLIEHAEYRAKIQKYKAEFEDRYNEDRLERALREADAIREKLAK